ncbi:MAG TPA: glycosyl hydrolase family 18 protein [Candidatus Limnocylindrales bacterium]|nr:glycosyl hydrolase family 18 protein [Candidatus Limnocylindrales bacterium]
MEESLVPLRHPSTALGVVAALSLLMPGAAVARPVGAAAGAGTPAQVVPGEARRPDSATRLDQAAPPAPEAAAELLPTIHYEDAQRHAADRPDFTPGDAVSVPFRPRRGDRWTVGGELPRALPAARASGRQLERQRNGTTKLPAEPVAPAGDGASTQEATAAPVEPPADADIRLGDGAGRPAYERTDATVVDATPVGPTGLHREVFGFLPYWELSDSTTRLDYASLSTIAYFGVGASRSGHLIKKDSSGATTVGWSGWTSSRLTTVMNDAHAAGTRVVLTVQRFAWTTSQTEDTIALLSSSTARQTLANEIAAAVRDRGADGVNLDFEPLPSGQGANFVTFVRQVRAALDAKAAGYQLTFDSTGWIGNYDITALTASGAADAVFIMGYDYRTASSSRAGSIAPLSSSGYDLTDTVQAYLAKTSASKIILGLPWYGRAWSTTTSDPNAPTRAGSSSYGYSNTAVYSTAYSLAVEKGRRYDSKEQSAWSVYQYNACSSCPATWRELYYDDSQSLAAKYDLINRLGLRGAGIWALGYDGSRTELSAGLRAKFLNDTTPPRAGIKLLPATSTQEGIRVDWTAVDDWTGVTAHDVQVSVDGGSWTAWLTSTTHGSGTYLARTGHTYAFRTRARDGKGNWGAWAVTANHVAAPAIALGAFGRTVSSRAMRASPDASSLSVGSLASGNLVAILDGPRAADGYTWYLVDGPLSEWAPVSSATKRGWVAVSDGSTAFVVAAQSPNATLVRAELSGLTMGPVASATLRSASSLADPVNGPHAFSPNGDGLRDALRINYHLSHTMDSLTLRVYRASDRALLGSLALPGLRGGDHSFDWDGRLGGSVVPDGTILIQLVGVKAGLSYAVPAPDMTDPTLPLTALVVTVDTVPPTLTAPAATYGAFSPNGDGYKDLTRISATAGGAATWRVELLAGSRIVRSFAGSGGTIAATWDGRDGPGTRVADGTYTARVTATDGVGNSALRSRSLVVDTIRPTGSLSASAVGAIGWATPNAFSPNGDGFQDQADLRWSFGERAAGTLYIKRGTATVRYTKIGWGTGGTFRWDGRDGYGRLVAEGSYTLLARIVDPAGNRATLIGYVMVDRTAGFLRATPRLWYPQDGDALAKTSSISFRLTRTATTTLRVVRADGSVVRTAWSARRLAAGTWKWTWDGRDAYGRLVAPGTYGLRLYASSGLGKQILAHTTTLTAFIVRLSSATPSAGDVLTVIATTAEPLKSAPTVTLKQSGLSARTVTAIKGSDGRYRASFTIAVGGSGAASVTVSGLDTGGQRNTTTVGLTVR